MMQEVKTILIIEDEPLNLELEKALFKAAGYTVLEAEDAKDGISIARGKNPDIIVLDYQMPKMNGIQVIRKLQRDSKTRGIPCIIVTASTTEEEKKMLEKSDACGFITKPINTRTFVDQVIKLASKRTGR